MTNESYARLVRFGAIYDLIATAGLAIPPVAAVVLNVIQGLDAMLGFDTAFQPVDATTMFLINLAGCFVIIWAIARLRMPGIEVGRMDAGLRLALVVLQVWAVIRGATPILLGIGLVLAIIAIMELRRPLDRAVKDQGPMQG